MRVSLKHILLIVFVAFAQSLLLAQAPKNFKVLTYNMLNFPNSDNNNAFGNDANRASNFRQIVDATDADVILMQEITDISAGSILINELNSNSISGKTFAHSVYVGYGFPNAYLGNMLIYNTDKFTLLNTTEVSPNNIATASNGNVQTAPRGSSRYLLEIESTDCAAAKAQIYFYSLHLKGGDDNANSNEAADRDRRLLGIEDLRDDLLTLPANANIVLGGDFNFYSPNNNGTSTSEPAYANLTDNTYSNYFIDELGFWVRNSNSYQAKYTQSTRTAQSQFGNGGTTGGMDDRFDFIFYNQNISNISNQIKYVNGSYENVANVNVPANGNALDGTSPLKTQVHQNSDHFPVLVEMQAVFTQIPACNGCSFSPSINNLPTVISNTGLISLQGQPSGGTFSGPGMIANFFNPNLVGNGVFGINYSFTDNTGCQADTTYYTIVLSIFENFGPTQSPNTIEP